MRHYRRRPRLSMAALEISLAAFLLSQSSTAVIRRSSLRDNVHPKTLRILFQISNFYLYAVLLPSTPSRSFPDKCVTLVHRSTRLLLKSCYRSSRTHRVHPGPAALTPHSLKRVKSATSSVLSQHIPLPLEVRKSDG